MGTQMVEYDIYLPTRNNRGVRYPKKVLQKIKNELVSKFGGLTDFRHKNNGIWKAAGVTFHDEVILLRVLASTKDRSKDFFKTFKPKVEKELNQDRLLITEKNIRAL